MAGLFLPKGRRETQILLERGARFFVRVRMHDPGGRDRACDRSGSYPGHDPPLGNNEFSADRSTGRAVETGSGVAGYLS